MSCWGVRLPFSLDGVIGNFTTVPDPKARAARACGDSWCSAFVRGVTGWVSRAPGGGGTTFTSFPFTWMCNSWENLQNHWMNKALNKFSRRVCTETRSRCGEIRIADLWALSTLDETSIKGLLCRWHLASPAQDRSPLDVFDATVNALTKSGLMAACRD